MYLSIFYEVGKIFSCKPHMSCHKYFHSSVCFPQVENLLVVGGMASDQCARRDSYSLEREPVAQIIFCSYNLQMFPKRLTCRLSVGAGKAAAHRGDSSPHSVTAAHTVQVDVWPKLVISSLKE